MKFLAPLISSFLLVQSLVKAHKNLLFQAKQSEGASEISGSFPFYDEGTWLLESSIAIEFLDFLNLDEPENSNNQQHQTNLASASARNTEPNHSASSDAKAFPRKKPTKPYELIMNKIMNSTRKSKLERKSSINLRTKYPEFLAHIQTPQSPDSLTIYEVNSHRILVPVGNRYFLLALYLSKNIIVKNISDRKTLKSLCDLEGIFKLGEENVSEILRRNVYSVEDDTAKKAINSIERVPHMAPSIQTTVAERGMSSIQSSLAAVRNEEDNSVDYQNYSALSNQNKNDDLRNSQKSLQSFTSFKAYTTRATWFQRAFEIKNSPSEIIKAQLKDSVQTPCIRIQGHETFEFWDNIARLECVHINSIRTFWAKSDRTEYFAFVNFEIHVTRQVEGSVDTLRNYLYQISQEDKQHRIERTISLRTSVFARSIAKWFSKDHRISRQELEKFLILSVSEYSFDICRLAFPSLSVMAIEETLVDHLFPNDLLEPNGELIQHTRLVFRNLYGQPLCMPLSKNIFFSLNVVDYLRRQRMQRY